jgi:LPS sulfotransferase NodH
MNIDELVNFEFDEPGEPRVSYLICSMPRSGSNLLCDLLSETGIAGAPTELFHPDMMRRLQRRWGTHTIEEYVAQLLARKTGPNGVFGAKAHWGQYQPYFGDMDPRQLFPDLRFVFMHRRDHLRQAVSWVRSLQTLHWESTQPKQDRSAVFDPEHITRKLGRIAREEEFWRDFFDRLGCEAHDVVYEDLTSSKHDTLHSLLEFVGASPPADFELPVPVLERQADALSEEWVERYRAEAASA